MQEYQYFPNSNIMKFYHTIENLSELNMQKVSTFYHILTFLGNFCNSGKLSVLKQQHVYLQNSMVKAILDIFIENRDAKHYSK